MHARMPWSAPPGIDDGVVYGSYEHETMPLVSGAIFYYLQNY